MSIISEGTVKIASNLGIPTKKDDVFYNPVMKLNRDISLLVLRCFGKIGLQVADPMAGSGIRSLRFLKELPEEIFSSLWINDLKENFKNEFEENAELNQLSVPEFVTITSKDATIGLLESVGFDYIDIDPFGSPNVFLDAAIKRSSRGGILAVTATDTAPLCGTYPKACKRKYWAKPLRNYLMHEMGLRILTRKCQLVGAQYDKALIPVLSYSLDHYFRIFFRVQKGKAKVDEILRQHDYYEDAGPLWLGNLGDSDFLDGVYDQSKTFFKEHEDFVRTLFLESKVGAIGFYDIHEVGKELKISPPKSKVVFEELQRRKIMHSPTHFVGTGVRCDCSKEEFIAAVIAAQK